MTIITRLNQLSADRPTPITPMTSVEIDGCYLDFDGNTEDACAPGARWTLRREGTDARVRDVLIV